MKSLLLTAAVSALALGANAQISVIPEAGVTLANYRYTETMTLGAKTETGTSSTNAGFRGGVNVGFGIGNNLSIQPGLFFAMKGGKRDLGGITGDTRFNYLELPLNAVYYFGDNQSGFFINAGGYAGMLLTAKLELSGGGQSGTLDYKIGGDEAKDDLRRWDVGGQAGVGYQLRNGFMIRAQYFVGGMNIKHHNQSDDAIRNGVLNIGVGYKFGF